MNNGHPFKLDYADFPIPKPLKYTCTHGINHKMRRFCEEVNHFTKHLVQLIMANKNHLNLPVFVGVFLRFDDFTQPAAQPRVDGDDRSAWAPVVGQPDIMWLMPPKNLVAPG